MGHRHGHPRRPAQPADRDPADPGRVRGPHPAGARRHRRGDAPGPRLRRPRAGELRSVLLVGGSSRIPLVGQMLMSELQRPVAIDVHPKHAVALGAALLSAAGGPDAGPPVDSRWPRWPRRRHPGRGHHGHVAHGTGSGAPPPPAAPAPAPPAGPPAACRRARGRRAVALALIAGVAAAAVAPWSAGALLRRGRWRRRTAQRRSRPRPRRRSRPGAPPVEVPQGPPLDATTIAYTQKDGSFWNIWRSRRTGPTPGPSPASRPPSPGCRCSRRTGGRWRTRWRPRRLGAPGDRHGGGATGCSTVDRARRPRHVVARRHPAGLRHRPRRAGRHHVLDLATGELTNLTNSPEDEGDPSWSPDGVLIAYWSRRRQPGHLRHPGRRRGAAPADRGPGRRRRPVVEAGRHALAFSSQREGDWEIFVIDPDGGDQVQLTDAPPTTRTRRGRRTAPTSPSRPSATPRRPTTRPRSTS